MASPATRSSVRRAARPLPGATWQAHVVDVGAITAELNRLWARFGSDHVRPAVSTEGHAQGDPVPASIIARASTLNLTAVARSQSDAQRIEDAVTHLSDLNPSRATILVADPDRPPSDDPGLDVRVSLLEQDAGKGRPAIRFECVTVEVAAVDERHLASIASPLLVVDLPDFLWWVGDTLAGSELFSDLLEVSDRVIVDSGAFLNPSAELRHLSALLCRAQGCPRLSDFAWARLVPWRQVITQFFDPPAARDALASLDEVTITYGSASATSGFTAALLLAGWLGSRLDWQPPGELVPARDDPGAWRATLRAGARGRRRELVLTLRPSPSAVAGQSLGQVLLAAHGTAAARFNVERTDPLGLSTLSSTREKPEVRRLVYAEEPDDAALLADELRIFGRDPVFEAALAFASGLVPDAFTAGGSS